MSGYGTTFPRLRAAAGDHWAAYTRHAFVAQLAAGTLPRAAFLGYLRQDYLFLLHFARAWALAVTKSDDLAEMRPCAATVDALLNHEMALHVKTCAAHGIDEGTLRATQEHPANLAYTRYVLDAGHAGDMADLLAALMPCVLGYGEIGARLAAGGVDPAHPYAGWIETYGGAEYQQVCTQAGALLDRAIARRLGDAPEASPRWGTLCHRLTTATRLEVAFWDMGLGFGEEEGPHP